MMRVLQVINRLNRGGGAEKFVFDLSTTLNSIKGVSVDILSICKPQNTDFTNEVARFGLHHYVSSGTSPWRNLPRIIRFLGEGRYDVIHVHLFPALYIVALATLFLRQKPKLIYTEHSTSNRRRGKKLFQLLDHIIYTKYDSVVGISEEVKQKLNLHAKLNNIAVIPNGVNIKQIDAIIEQPSVREELRLPFDAVVVTMVGRFVPGKDYSTLIQALFDLPDNVHIICVGDGPLREKIQSQTIRRPFANRVHFLGLRSDVISILKSSDIIVLSTEHEGFSISMLEAMACSKPFVASAVLGVKDIVGDSALLFEYQNAADLAGCIQSLIADKELYDTMSAKSRAFAKEYDMGLIAKKYFNVYKQGDKLQ